MGSYVRDHIGAVSLSVLMHLAIVMLLLFSVSLGRSRVVTAPQPSSIEVVMVDRDPVAALNEVRNVERERERELERERERVQVEREQQERERVRLQREQSQREADERQAEQQRIAVERQQREEAELVAAEEAAEAAARAEEERRLEEEARRLEEERQVELRRQEEEERRRAEERRQQESREQALQEALAAEEAARQAEQDVIDQAVRSGEFDRYIRQIQVAIEQAWSPPASAGPGLECVVYVTQVVSGDVTSVTIGSCNGDAAVRRSIEAAVLRASPLPRPGIPALFDRNLEVTFRPQF